MRKLNPAVTIELDYGEGKVKLQYKDLIGKKAKELGKKFEKINKVQDKKERIARRIKLAETELDAYSAVGSDPRQVDRIVRQLEKLYDTAEKLEVDYEKLGGLGVYDKFSEGQFKLSCAGDEEEFKHFVKWIEENHSYYATMVGIVEEVALAKGK